MSFQNKSKIKQILLKQSRNKERFEALFKCTLNKEDQLDNENIQKGIFLKLFHEIKIKHICRNFNIHFKKWTRT